MAEFRLLRAAVGLASIGLLRAAVVLASIGLLAFPSCAPERESGTEILWDTYGVPHIYSEVTEDLFDAQGYAQMQAHGDLILRLYGQARGRAAVYWGVENLISDFRMHSLSVPELAEEWASAQDSQRRWY